MHTPGSDYRPDIDGLRAFSIISVVIYHAFPTVLPGGFIGVDIFFVISGYLISNIILRDLDSASFSLAHFYRRRVQRIIPALLLVLLFSLAAGALVLLPFEYANLGKHTAAGSAFIPNIVYWTESGYFDTESKLKPLLHLWSLGVEEQFYLAWPLLLLLASRVRLKPQHLLIPLMLLSFAAGIAITGDRAASFYLPQFRAWELLAGALLAWLQLNGHRLSSSRTAFVTASAGLVLMCLATLLINRQVHFPGWWALLPVTGAVMVIAAGYSSPINRLLGHPLLVFIGKISFPLYLWHWPLLSFARIMETGEPSLIIRCAAVALSLLLAWLSYRLVEIPLRYHPGRWVPALLLTALFGLGAAGLLVMRLEGVPQRTADINPLVSTFYWQELGLHTRDDCTSQFEVPGRCLSDGKVPQIAVVGDSHSTNTFFALAHHYRDSAAGVVRLGKGGCPPLYNVQISDGGNRDHCLAVTNGNLDWVLANPNIHKVFLSSMGPMYVNPGQKRYQMHSTEAPTLVDNGAIFAAGLEGSVARLLAAGKEVVVVIDWPALGFDPQACVNTRPLRLSSFMPIPCETTRKRHDQRTALYRSLLQDFASRQPGIKFWVTSEFFCDEQRCRGALDGRILYRDRSHLSMEGSHLLGESMELTPAERLRIQ